jgi:hypothetical protein
MIFSENRVTLFRIMLERNASQAKMLSCTNRSADDMPSQLPEQSKSKASKPARDRRSPLPQPQILPPLSNDGPEPLRDSHC